MANTTPNMKCGECLASKVEIVTLVNGICPKCGADYSATCDVFNIPIARKPQPKK